MKLIKTSDISQQHLFALICGPSGSGKTSLAKTLPHDKTLILSAESGLLPLQGVDIDVLEIKSYKDIEDCFAFLKKGSKYEHIFIDSLTELGEIVFAELKPNYSKSQTFGLYGDYAEKMTKLLKAFRDMTQYNTYFVALDKMTDKDFTQVVTIDLIQKSLSKKLPALFDLVMYYIKVDDGSGNVKRSLLSDSETLDFVKDRSGKLDKHERPDLGLIYNKIFKGE